MRIPTGIILKDKDERHHVISVRLCAIIQYNEPVLGVRKELPNSPNTPVPQATRPPYVVQKL